MCTSTDEGRMTDETTGTQQPRVQVKRTYS